MRLALQFPLWASMLSVAAYFYPTPFLTLDQVVGGIIVPLLGLVMFAMGLTLSVDDFRNVVKRKEAIALGVVLQFLLMPFFAWGLSHALALPASVMVGLIIVGACPGGTASNVICYLARGDVALSVSLTTVSTGLAVVATPLLTLLYIGHRLPVPVAQMLISIATIIIIPVLTGLAANHFFGRRLVRAKDFCRAISVGAIVLIIATIVAYNKMELHHLGLATFFAVVLHNGLGLASGYFLSRLSGFDARTARTVAIEVGMQNSGLGVALAVKYFSAAAALPGAVFSIWHNLSGSMFAAYCCRQRSGEALSADRPQ